VKGLARLYEADETAWLDRMVELIEARRYGDLDYTNLSEFLSSMAGRDRREVLRRLVVLLTHLLKWDHQPGKQSGSWRNTIRNQRDVLQDLLESKTLKNHAAEVLSKAYERAVRRAAAATGLAEDQFPDTCPYTVDALLAAPRTEEE
jgi:hypothetical protein